MDSFNSLFDRLGKYKSRIVNHITGNDIDVLAFVYDNFEKRSNIISHEYGHALAAEIMPGFDLNDITLESNPSAGENMNFSGIPKMDVTFNYPSIFEKRLLFSAGHIGSLLYSAMTFFAASRTKDPMLKSSLYMYSFFNSCINLMNVFNDYNLADHSITLDGESARSDFGYLIETGIPKESSLLLFGLPAFLIALLSGYEMIKPSLDMMTEAMDTCLHLNETREEFLMRTDPGFREMMERRREFHETRIKINEKLEERRQLIQSQDISLESAVIEKAL